MTAVAPGREMTFTINKAPRREAERKTIHRLMNMQPDVQRGLKKLHTKRRLEDNVFGTRAGRPWVARVKTTKLTRVAPGNSFTLFVTPQIVNDLKSVEKYLDAK